MRVKALRRVQVLRQTREQKLTQVEAVTVRGLTTRHIRRLLKRLAPAGDQGLAHRGRGTPANRRLTDTVDPRLAIGDGALGFWKALTQVWGHTRTQRCWVHKTVKVLNKFPKHLQANATSGLHQIWMRRPASTRIRPSRPSSRPTRPNI